MSLTCQQLKEQYETIALKKQELALAWKQGKETKDFTQTRALKKEIEELIDTLKQYLWPFENLPPKELKRQYDLHLKAYQETGVIEQLPNNQWGIKGIDNKEYTFPTFKEIKKIIKENQEELKEKIELGFTRIQITTFALSSRNLKQHYGELIKKKHQEGKLKGIDGTPLELDKSKPVFMDEGFNNLLYFPEWKKDPNEDNTIAVGGITKRQAVKQIGGFNIILTEDTPKAPEQGQGQTKQAKNGKQRKQIESGMLPHEQYDKIKEYNEEGYTPEDWFCHSILELWEKDRVLDDDQQTNYYCRLLGVRFDASGDVPIVFWYRSGWHAYLSRSIPRDRNDHCGVRPAVRILKS